MLVPRIVGAQAPDPGEPYRPGDQVAEPAPEVETEDEELRDPYGSPSEARRTSQISSQVRYVLEGIVVVGNSRTKAKVVRKFIPLKQGDFLDPESPELLATEWRLMGTGWFDAVDIRLERGAERGYVVLVVQVKERNTVGKMPTTSVRRLISPFSRSIGFVEWSFVRCSLGKDM